MKIIASAWFTPYYPGFLFPKQQPCIGIVLGEDAVTGKEKAYIGYGAGFDKSDDAGEIAKHGSPFPVDAAKLLI